jgi:hypothetical protein
VTMTMINMCTVLKNRRRDDDDTRRHAGTARTRRGSAIASKYDEDEAAQQLGLNTSRDSDRGARIGIGGPHRRNGQIQQSTRR